MIVPAGAEIGDSLERPARSGAVEFQPLLLPLQIILGVVAGHASVGNGAKRRFWHMELFRAQPRQRSSGMSLPSRSQRRSVDAATPRNSAASWMLTIFRDMIHIYIKV